MYTNPVLAHVTNPYYLVTPPYVSTSAGIKALHLLCHHLNTRGYQAYIVPSIPVYADPISHDLITPVLTRKEIETHFAQKRCPIAVYPEVIEGNPLQAPLVARYVLNYPGLLGGSKTYDPKELIFCYSRKLADSFPTNVYAQVLFMLVTDTSVFYPPSLPVVRQGTCFYASKYQHHHQGKLSPITENSFEITRDQQNSPTPQQIADLFRCSELFYTYENTALAIEAAACGCPVVFIPNDYITGENLAEAEIGSDGFCFGTEPADIAHAKATVHLAFENYIKSAEKFADQLDNFISITQNKAQETPYTHCIDTSYVATNTTYYLSQNFYIGSFVRGFPRFFYGFLSYRYRDAKWAQWLRPAVRWYRNKLFNFKET